MQTKIIFNFYYYSLSFNMVEQIKIFKQTYQNCKCFKLLKQIQILFYIYLYSGVHAKDINKLTD